MNEKISGLDIKYLENDKIKINFKLSDTKLIGEKVNFKIGLYLKGNNGLSNDINGYEVFREVVLETSNNIIIDFNKGDLYNYKGKNFDIINKVQIYKVGIFKNDYLYKGDFQIGDSINVNNFKKEYISNDKRNLKYIYKMFSYKEKLILKFLFFGLIGSIFIKFFGRDYVIKDFYNLASFYLEGCFPIIIAYIVYLFFFSDGFNYLSIKNKDIISKNILNDFFEKNNLGFINTIIDRISNNKLWFINSYLELKRGKNPIESLSIVSKKDLENYDIDFYLVTKEKSIKGSGKYRENIDEVVSSKLLYSKNINYSYKGEDISSKILRDLNIDFLDEINSMPKGFSFITDLGLPCGIFNYLLVVVKNDKLIDIERFFEIKK